MTTEKIWYEDPKVLIEPRKLVKYLPQKDDTSNEKINALMRLSLYISLILSVAMFNLNYLFIFILTGFITYVVNVSAEKKRREGSE